MKIRSASRLAAFCVALTLPLAGPVHADSNLVHLGGKASAVPMAAGSAAGVSTVLNSNVVPAKEFPGSPALGDTASQALVAEADADRFEPITGGMASYYGRQFAGARTASGQRFDPDGMTAAHRTLPFGTQLRVTNASTGDSVVVTVNDRGPFHGNRVVDLSDAAADQIGIRRAGSGKVQLAVLADS